MIYRRIHLALLPPTHQDEPWRRYALVFFAIAALMVVRRLGAFTYPTLYYEDGNVFFREQLLVAGFETLIQPYRDHYYLLVPRLAALIAWFFPASIAPHVLNGAGVIVAALSCALFSMSRFRIIVRGDAARVLLCILFAVSLDSREVLASAANCLWPVGIACLLLAAVPPDAAGRSMFGRIGWVVAGVVMALSSPVVALAIPIVAASLIARPRSMWYFPCGLLAGAAIQMAIQKTAGASIAATTSLSKMAAAVLVAIAQRICLSSVLGHEIAVRLSVMDVIAWPLLALLCLGGILGYLASLDTTVRWRALALLYVIVASVLLSLYGRDLWPQFQHVAHKVGFGGPRYFYIGSCAFAVLVALFVESVVLIRGARWRRLNSAATLALLVVVFGFGFSRNFRVGSGQDRGWSAKAAGIDEWKAKYGQDHRVSAVRVGLSHDPWELHLPPNYLKNGGFEMPGIAPWAPFGGAKADIVKAEWSRGTQSLSTDVHGNGGVLTELAWRQKGADFEVTALARAECGSGGQVSLWAHDSRRVSLRDGPAEAPCDRWLPLVVRGRISETRLLRIHLVTVGEDSRVYWDDVTFKVLR